jgi:hypothetical protein
LIAVLETLTPAPPHGFFVPADGFALAADTLMMEQHAVGGPDITQTGVQTAQTQIYIIADYRQFLIKTSQQLEAVTTNHQARTGAGRHFPYTFIELLVNTGTRQLFVEQMACAAAVIHQKNAAMLDGTIRVQQQAANGANVVLQSLPHQFLQPGGLYYFYIIVQEKQHVAGTVVHTFVVQA